MASWYDEMAVTKGRVKDEDDEKPIAAVIEEQLVTFLSLFDLEIGGGELARRAVEAVFKARPETVGNLQFDSECSIGHNPLTC